MWKGVNQTEEERMGHPGPGDGIQNNGGRFLGGS